MDTSNSTTPQKFCNSCKQWYPATSEYFHRRSDAACGLKSPCKECKSKQGAEYRARNYNHVQESRASYRERNRELLREKDREYQRANPEKSRLRSRRWRARNLERERERGRQYYRDNPKKSLEWKRANPDKARETHRRWRQNNPQVAKVRAHRRRAREQKLPSQFTAADWTFALEHFNHKCAVCGRPHGLWHKLVPDHWIPLASPNCPGTVPANIVPLCHGLSGCNNVKQHRDALEWLQDTFGKRKAKAIATRIEAYFELVR